MSLLLSDEEMLKTVSTIPQNIKPDKSITIFLQAECHAISKAQVEKIAKWLEDLPTDGWDKWLFHHRGLARKLRKEARL